MLSLSASGFRFSTRWFLLLLSLLLAGASPAWAQAPTLFSPSLSLIGTEITQPGNTAASEAVVGEFATYQAQLAIPDSSTVNNVQIVDTFGSGLAFVDVTSVTASAGLSSSLGTINAATISANLSYSTGTNQLTLNLGNVTNANSNPAVTETITITFRAVVTNILANQAGITLGNTALANYQGGTTAASPAGNVSVVKPTLSLARSVRNLTTSTGPAPSVNASTGDSIQYVAVLTVSDTTAYDLIVSDALPNLLGSPSISSVTGAGSGSITITGGLLSSAFEISGGTLQIKPGFNIDMQAATTITVTIQGTASSTGAVARTPGGYASWTSLDGNPGTRSTFSTNSTERTGADGAGPSLNNYRTSDPTVAINDFSLTEGDSGTTTMTFTVTRTGASSVPVSVNYATANNTAVAGSDYVATSGTATINPDQTSQTISVTINGDTLFEGNESFFVNLTSPVNTTISDNQGLGTITDDDAPASITVVSGNNQSAVFNNAFAAPLVTLVRNAAGNPVQGVTVSYTPPGSGASASFASPTPVTNASGQVSTGTATANGTVGGPYTVTAQATGGTAPSTIFSLTNANLPTLAINDVTVTEGDSGTLTMTLIVTRSGDTSLTSTANFATANNTAVAGSDYTAASGTLTFNPTESVKTINVTSNGDTLFEGNETFFVNLSGVSNATLSDGQGVGTITDDDAAASITVVSGNNQTTVVNTAFAAPLVAVVRNAAGNPVQGVTVTYTPPGSGASASFASPSPVSNASGQVSTGTVTANGTAGGPYTITATATGGTAPSTTFSLTNLPPTALSINDVSIDEGNAGATTFNFTVTASPVNPGATVTVDWATANNGATTADDDYVAASGTLTFAPGVATQTISVTVNGDTKYEGPETFFVNLSNPTNATILDSQGVGTITNDDAQPTFSINDVTQAEGDSGTTNFVFTVSLSAVSGVTTTVDVRTGSGTAQGEADYILAIGTISFPPGTTTRTVPVPVKGDTVFEPDEQFVVNLWDATNATIADNEGVGTILNDDAAPTLTINDVSASESAGTLTFTVTRTGATESPVSVSYATADGTAVSTGSTPGTPDYTATSGTLSFSGIGTTETQTFTVALTNDDVFENTEQFAANLSNATGATIADAQGIATITDTDRAPSFSINDVTVTEGNSGTTDATFTIRLLNATSVPVSVSYATASSTADSGSDFVATSGTLDFPASTEDDRSQTITVQVNGDTSYENDESFKVNLTNATNGAAIGIAQGTGTITNDDDVPLVSITRVTQAEGNSGPMPFVFTVSLSTPSGRLAKVDYATDNNTASTTDDDYQTTSGSLTFAPGEGSKTITVLVNGDTKVETEEKFYLRLTSPVNASFGTYDDTAPPNEISGLPENGATLRAPRAIVPFTILSGEGIITNDDAPVVYQDVNVIPQDAPFIVINGASFDPTAANNTVVFNLGAAGTVAQATTGNLKVNFTTPPAIGGVLTAVVTTDGVSSGAPVQVAVVDAIPDAQDDVAFVSPGSFVVIDVLANDSDSGGDPFSITAVSPPAHGTATIEPGGQAIRYTPADNPVVPDSFTYTIIDSHNTTATANVSVSDRVTTLGGSYAGLVQNAPTRSVQDTFAAGVIKATVNGKTAKFTGSLKIAGQTYPFAGTFDEASGNAVFGPANSPSPTFAIKRKKDVPLTLALRLSFDASGARILGTLSLSGTPFAELEAGRALYTAAKNPAPPLKNVPAEQVGRYTIAFSTHINGPAGRPYPQGHGYGFATVAKSGSVRFTGILADGTKISATSPITAADRWPFYASFAGGKGSISGFALFDLSPSVPDDVWAPELTWFKPASPTAKYYPTGWTSGIPALFIGSKLTRPPATPPTSIIPNLPPIDAVNGNARISFYAGDLPSSFNKAINITPQDLATVLTPGSEQLSVTLRGTTAISTTPKLIGFYENNGIDYPLIQTAPVSTSTFGLFSGKFTPDGATKPTPFRGVILQKRQIGLGFFLGPTESGEVDLSLLP